MRGGGRDRHSPPAGGFTPPYGTSSRFLWLLGSGTRGRDRFAAGGPPCYWTKGTAQRRTSPMPKGSAGFAFAVCATTLALTSCVTPEELRREDEATCVGYGFRPDTDAFAACLQRDSLARRLAISFAPPAPYWGYWGRWWGP